MEAAIASRERWGQPAVLETCPQYLLLDRSCLEGEYGQRFLCSPPLRDPEDVSRLWEALDEGRVDWVGSDHCLFLAGQKDALADAFWDCPHGLPGVETRVGLILAEGLRRNMSLRRLVEVTSTSAARWYGLYPRKGTLLPGSDADLAVWRLDDRRTVRNGDLHMGCDWTPFDGVDTLNPPRLVLVRGRATGGDGVEAPDGWGEFIARTSAATGKVFRR